MSKPAFVGRFLAIFALLIVAGWATQAPSRYAAMLRTSVAAASPVLTGWWIETRDDGGRIETWFRRGGTGGTDEAQRDHELKLLLSLDALALGLLPLLSLLGATPGLGWKRLVACAAIGVGALFALDALVLLLYPALVSGGALPDIAGTFLGILTFVGGPVILWFVLTFDRMRGVWRLPVAPSADRPERTLGTRAGKSPRPVRR
jgi:hypothetical protein